MWSKYLELLLMLLMALNTVQWFNQDEQSPDDGQVQLKHVAKRRNK
jgi:hypothetical protein